jgi:hypothetical protein
MAIPAAYYTTGYFGVDDPGTMKMFRSCQIITDPFIVEGNFTVHAKIVDYESHLVAAPLDVDLGTIILTYVSICHKARIIAWKIEFPTEDIACGVMEMSNSCFELSGR